MLIPVETVIDEIVINISPFELREELYDVFPFLKRIIKQLNPKTVVGFTEFRNLSTYFQINEIINELNITLKEFLIFYTSEVNLPSKNMNFESAIQYSKKNNIFLNPTNGHDFKFPTRETCLVFIDSFRVFESNPDLFEHILENNIIILLDKQGDFIIEPRLIKKFLFFRIGVGVYIFSNQENFIEKHIENLPIKSIETKYVSLGKFQKLYFCTKFDGQKKDLEIKEFQKKIVKLKGEIEDFNRKYTVVKFELDEMKKSKIWNMGLVVRQTRLKTMPENSLQWKIIKPILQKLISLRRNKYKKWIRKNEPSVIKIMFQKVKSLFVNNDLKISIITPVFNPPNKIIKKTIQSVLNQTYFNWELILVNASGENHELKLLLNNYAKYDKRIKVFHLDRNLGIAGNTNFGIQKASAGWIAFLDHDDTLAKFALFDVYQEIKNNSAIDMLYSDEDKIKEDNDKERYDVYFKPDFNPELLMSINYISHFLVVKKELGDRVGWLRSGFEGAQDFDLILRLTASANKVEHISRVLYHWRAMEGSTAQTAEAKPEAAISGIKALEDHLKNIGLDGEVKPGPFLTSYRVSPVLNNEPLISIIIPNHNNVDDLMKCINSILLKTIYKNYEILIIENNSTNQDVFNYYKELQKNPHIKVLSWNYPFNFSSINNWAANQAQGEILLFLNNDVEVITTGWLGSMTAQVLRENVGAVGTKLYYPDDTIQHAGVIVGMGGIAGHCHYQFPRESFGYFGRLVLNQNFSAVTAACLMIKKEVFGLCDGFDEKYKLAFGDVDLCMKITRSGYEIVWLADVELYHYESKTRGYEDTPEKQERFLLEIRTFQNRWSQFLKGGDPFYNKNLSLIHTDFSLKL